MAQEKPTFVRPDDPINNDWMYRFDGTNMVPKKGSKWTSEALSPFVSGYWHAAMGVNGFFSLAMTQSRVQHTPMVVPPGASTLTGLAAYLNSAGVGTGMVLRFGAYTFNTSTNLPVSRLVDAGTVSATTPGSVEITGLSVDVSTYSLIWLSVVAQATVWTTAPNLYFSYDTALRLAYAASGNACFANIGCIEDSITGALPATATASAYAFAPNIVAQFT